MSGLLARAQRMARRTAPRGGGLLWLLIGIVALVVGTNGAMLWLALRTHPDLVRSDYYEASKHQDGLAARYLAGAQLGWRVTATPDAAAPGDVRLRVRDAQGAPVAGLSGTVAAYRPADAALDQALPLAPDTAEPGGYRIAFARRAPGLWRLTLDLHRGEERFLGELRLVQP